MSAQRPTEDDYQFLPLDEAAAAPAGEGPFMHYTGRWWIVHPERGLAFYNPVNERTRRRRHDGLGAPTANSSEKIQRYVAEKLVQAAGWPAQAVLIESAWFPIKIEGYL